MVRCSPVWKTGDGGVQWPTTFGQLLDCGRSAERSVGEARGTGSGEGRSAGETTQRFV